MFENPYIIGQKKLLSGSENKFLSINSKILCSESKKTNLSLFHYFVINAADISINLELVLKTFLSAGININQQAKKFHGYYSALHFAVDFPENLSLVKLLTKNGINLDLKDENGNTAFFNACFNFRGKQIQKDIIEFLSSVGSSYDIKNDAGISVKEWVQSLGESIDQGINPKEWDLRQLTK